MDRPYVVCHILTSLNGKIDGDFFAAQATVPAQKAYGSLRNVFECQATIYGTTTMLGGYSDGSVPTLTPKGRDYPKEDHKAPNHIQNYIVSVDPEGILGWQSNTIEKKGRAKKTVDGLDTKRQKVTYLQRTSNISFKHVLFKIKFQKSFDEGKSFEYNDQIIIHQRGKFNQEFEKTSVLKPSVANKCIFLFVELHQ